MVRGNIGGFQGNNTSGWSLKVRGGADGSYSTSEDGEVGRVGRSNMGYPGNGVGGNPHQPPCREGRPDGESEGGERRGRGGKTKRSWRERTRWLPGNIRKNSRGNSNEPGSLGQPTRGVERMSHWQDKLLTSSWATSGRGLAQWRLHPQLLWWRDWRIEILPRWALGARHSALCEQTLEKVGREGRGSSSWCHKHQILQWSHPPSNYTHSGHIHEKRQFCPRRSERSRETQFWPRNAAAYRKGAKN